MRGLRALLVSVSLLAAFLISAGARGDGDLLDGGLGRWIDDQAAPALAETLGKHPRFKGETVRLVAMQNGRPAAKSNRLSQAVQQRLTRRLLREKGVRIAWGDERRGCTPPRSRPLLLGVEIEPASAGNFRLHIGVVDMDEGVWVAGVSHTWTGRLSSAARAAMREDLQVGAAGSVENPLPLADTGQIGELLRTGMACALPGGVDGLVFLAPSEAELATVAQSLANALRQTALANVTTEQADAQWVMQLSARPTARGHELTLTLRDAQGAHAEQQLAAVMVTGLSESPASAVAERPPERVLPPAANRAQPSLAERLDEGVIGELRLREARSRGICATSQGCVEVGFRLKESAYVLVFSTESQRLQPRSCMKGIRQSTPGERWFRMHVSPTAADSARPDAGFYVLAVRQRSLAYRVGAHLNRLCSAAPTSMAQWLGELEVLLGRDPGAVDWRSVHLSHSPAGVVRL